MGSGTRNYTKKETMTFGSGVDQKITLVRNRESRVISVQCYHYIDGGELNRKSLESNMN